jgi:MTH538 TIR-like domain (DUF1863)
VPKHATDLIQRRTTAQHFRCERVPENMRSSASRFHMGLLDSLSVAINSENGSYVKQALREKIQRTSVLVCLIGNGTAWRDWVDWEIRTAYDMGKGACGVRLKGSRGRCPSALADRNAPVASWEMTEIIAAIECAAARRG